MTLNLLQAARCKPKFSVCSYFDGQHDLNNMPPAPLGTNGLFIENNVIKISWTIMDKFVGLLLQERTFINIFCLHMWYHIRNNSTYCKIFAKNKVFLIIF